MKSVKQIAEEIVAREGGFVNDPDDPGGATKYGVTIHTIRRLGLDLDRDGNIDVNDVLRVSRPLAVQVFTSHYFTRPRIHLLPEPLQASVFDMYVNAGSNAVRILQRVLSKFAFALTIDGIIGPKTAEAAEAVYRDAGELLVDAYGIARRDYYFRLADRRPASRKYARTRKGKKGGWINRAEEFISPRFHLSDEQFQRRVARWA